MKTPRPSCSVPGCPCLVNWRGYPPGTTWRERQVDADDMDVSNVLRRRDAPGAPGAGLSWHDRYRTFLRLDERGYSASRIARTLGCTPRTVIRWRKAAARATEMIT